ncbi:MAG TPA: kelch repeat-containing protein, partial [Kofleriaceae bacterium]
PSLREVVLFGGRDASGAVADTWSWNGSRWQQLQPATAPSPRMGHAMVTDFVRGGIMLFGGEVVESMFSGESDETWVWHDGQWKLLFRAEMQPMRRAFSAMAPFGNGVLMVSGGTFKFPDAWYWEGAFWRPSLPGPTMRFRHAMAYASPTSVVLFGGIGETSGPLDDTWVWDGDRWQQPVLMPRPGARHDHAMVYDAIRRYSIVVDGQGPSSTLYDLWGFRFEREGAPEETCIAGEDGDADSLPGCLDPDCWGLCNPHCPPGLDCDPAEPHCGDGTCNDWLEPGVCPKDCGS